jgi:hypothetical protein
MANKWDKSEEGKAYHKNYQRKNTQFSINFRKDSGILPLLDAACAKNGITRTEYLRLAVAERLEEEGYEMGYKTSSTNNA